MIFGIAISPAGKYYYRKAEKYYKRWMVRLSLQKCAIIEKVVPEWR
jgi:hypothetical protein